MRNRLTVILLCVFSLLAGGWMGCASIDGIGWADDFPYAHMPLQGGSEQDFFDCKGEVIRSFAQVPQACSRHFIAVNGRLANMLAFGVLQFSGWLNSLLDALAYAGMLCGIMRLAFGYEWRRHSLALTLTAAALWVVLPWQDNLASQDYYMNYVWSSALNLIFLSLLLNPSRRVPHAMLLLLGAVAALMHEGMSAAMCVGLLLLFLRRRAPRLPLVVYALCTFAAISSPGIWGLAAQRTSSPLDLHFFTHTIGLACWPVALAALVTVIKFRRRKLNPAGTQVLLWSIILAGVAICIVSHQGGRALWLPLCLSVVVMLRCVRVNLGRKTQLTLTAIAAVGLCMWSVWLCAWQYYASAERNLLMKQLTSDCDRVYIDLLQPDEIPWALLGTVAYVNGDQTVRSNIAAHLYGDAWHPLGLMPRSWKGKEKESLPSIPGTAGASGHPYLFLSRKEIKEARYLHTPGGVSTVARHPLKSIRSYLRPEPREETMMMDCYRLSDSLWLCRPLYFAPSLIGIPVSQIDAMNHDS